MAFVTRNKEEGASLEWKRYLLPGYIVVSLLFIVYVVYSTIVGGIYNLGLNNGAQQGFKAAVAQLMEQAGTKCDPVDLTLDNQKIQIVNYACTQQGAASAAATEPAQQDAPVSAE